MNLSLQELRSQIVQLWQGMGLGQRFAIAVVGALAIALIASVALWARSPEYAAAFSNLSEEDAAAIVNKLKEAKTPYELASGGTTIMVPSSLLYDTRLQIASSGLPQGGSVGFELFNQSSFGMTDFAQKVNYQRALEGELSRTINRLGPVEQSRVHVVIPQPSLYSLEQKEASASVVLKLRPGQRLTQSQVQGIVNLVSSSVEGLRPQNLTIIDANGNVLSDVQSAGKDPQKAGSALMEAQLELEGELEQKAQVMLDRVLGPGKANVRVRAVMDWDQYEANSEFYSPASYVPQIRSSRTITEWQGEGSSQDGTAGSQGGVPGVVANVPGYAGILSGTAGLGSSGKTESSINYDLSKTVEKVVRTPGSIKKLSVAVVLDGAQPIEQERMDSISRLVSAAVGIDQQRGDSFAISSIPFNRTTLAEELKALEEAQQREAFAENARLGAMAIGPLLLLLVMFLVLRRQGSRQASHRVREIHDGSRQLGPAGAQGAESSPRVLPERVPVGNLASLNAARSNYMREVAVLAKNQPETVALLVRTWLEEDGKR